MPQPAILVHLLLPWHRLPQPHSTFTVTLPREIIIHHIINVSRAGVRGILFTIVYLMPGTSTSKKKKKEREQRPFLKEGNTSSGPEKALGGVTPSLPWRAHRVLAVASVTQPRTPGGHSLTLLHPYFHPETTKVITKVSWFSTLYFTRKRKVGSLTVLIRFNKTECSEIH